MLRKEEHTRKAEGVFCLFLRKLACLGGTERSPRHKNVNQLRRMCGKVKACIPHILQTVNRQEIGGHGEVQLVDEGGHFGRRVQQVDDGAAQLTELGLEGNAHLRTPVGIRRGRRPSPRRHGPQWPTRTMKGSILMFKRTQQSPRAASSVLGRARILTGVTVSFFMAELYWRTDRSGSLLGKVSRGDLVAISQTPSYHSSGQSPEREGTSEMIALAGKHCSGVEVDNF